MSPADWRISVPERGNVGGQDGMPYREILDGDSDRGVALYDAELRLLYANPAARAVLHDPDGRVAASLLTAVGSFRDRLDRSDVAPPPGEIMLGGGTGRGVRATISPLFRGTMKQFVVRFAPPGLFAEPSVRSLQTRFRLTLRESQVALAVAKGATNAEAARGLGITEKTVKNALMAVFAKCQVRNRAELALRANDRPVGGA
jgi:DNA-binding CsgD family transcriptional regulator